MKAIIVSKKDKAGMNIKECLLRIFDFKETKPLRIVKFVKLK
jgi:D-tyrosyl-tRNA(Tyr) deacylase